MSLDITLTAIRPTTVYDANITHNLGRMAKEAGIYEHLWRPAGIGVNRAWHLIEPLKDGIALMKSDPPRFAKHNADNSWGTYDQFLPWLEKLLEACEANPDADISVSV